MAKIEYVINANMERIYPKTHEDAILTTDGYTLKQKFAMIYEALNNKANIDHKHDFSDLKNIPDSFPCKGGDADTVMGRNVDDTIITEDNLWTANHIHNLLQQLNDKILDFSDIVYYGINEPPTDDPYKKYFLWINPTTGIVKYYYNNSWIQPSNGSGSGSEIKGLQFEYDKE